MMGFCGGVGDERGREKVKRDGERRKRDVGWMVVELVLGGPVGDWTRLWAWGGLWASWARRQRGQRHPRVGSVRCPAGSEVLAGAAGNWGCMASCGVMTLPASLAPAIAHIWSRYNRSSPICCGQRSICGNAAGRPQQPRVRARRARSNGHESTVADHILDGSGTPRDMRGRRL